MTEANRRPATGDLSNVPTTPARHPAQTRPTNGTAPDPLEIAARALEGATPATESWFTPGSTPVPRPARLRYTPYAQLPQHAYQPHPYAAPQPYHQQPRPIVYANPAMPPYAAAQAPTPRGSRAPQPDPVENRPGRKAVLMPLAAMAIASATIGAFAQANFAGDPSLQAQTKQVKAQADHYDAVPVIDLRTQDVIDAPGVIVPKEQKAAAPAGAAAPEAPFAARATVGGKHSNGNYDAPSEAETYGGAHTMSEEITPPSSGGDTSTDPAPAPEPEPEPAPQPEPEPAPEPEPQQPKRLTLGETVIAPTLDATTGIVKTLTGIEIDLTR
ncbi:hypothetical protein J2S40_003541 [Nocardioides luteus]|uniref:Uncharacterized protein n=1 Tax=Nocardioides luteus TaxID=1844 RepID=A0ABQ5SYP8_9ACTN|nr:hypothetical protein [Nocardioides luteus]MDR7312483.1 hypothetical protein [Nocardioides luteus]GGR73947.1 hypothetical protein GCM10010197_46520 [Nocardioides luteus]GLJ68730.1 hypothetical protein GCM10017579_27660 [Nocardioides luteus]